MEQFIWLREAFFWTKNVNPHSEIGVFSVTHKHTYHNINKVVEPRFKGVDKTKKNPNNPKQQQ